MPIHGPSRQSAAQPLRRWARMLAGALLVVAGLILIADPDLG
jgi:sulfite exporter TauE/SafE